MARRQTEGSSTTSILHLEGFRLIRESSRGLHYLRIYPSLELCFNLVPPSPSVKTVIVLGGRKVYESWSVSRPGLKRI